MYATKQVLAIRGRSAGGLTWLRADPPSETPDESLRTLALVRYPGASAVSYILPFDTKPYKFKP